MMNIYVCLTSFCPSANLAKRNDLTKKESALLRAPRNVHSQILLLSEVPGTSLFTPSRFQKLNHIMITMANGECYRLAKTTLHSV
jgi:hypothetical protein